MARDPEPGFGNFPDQARLCADRQPEGQAGLEGDLLPAEFTPDLFPFDAPSDGVQQCEYDVNGGVCLWFGGHACLSLPGIVSTGGDSSKSLWMRFKAITVRK